MNAEFESLIGALWWWRIGYLSRLLLRRSSAAIAKAEGASLRNPNMKIEEECDTYYAMMRCVPKKKGDSAEALSTFQFRLWTKTPLLRRTTDSFYCAFLLISNYSVLLLKIKKKKLFTTTAFIEL